MMVMKPTTDIMGDDAGLQLVFVGDDFALGVAHRFLELPDPDAEPPRPSTQSSNARCAL